MSGNDEFFSEEERNLEDDDEEYSHDDNESESSDEEEALSAEEHRLWNAVMSGDADAAAEAIQQAIRDGANVNAVRNATTPLSQACYHGNAGIVGIFLDAGADARWSNGSATHLACSYGHLSTVQVLINHDRGLLEIAVDQLMTPLLYAILEQHPDIVRFLLDQGADPHHVNEFGETALIQACNGRSLEIVRLLLADGVDVEARDVDQQTALHHAACWAGIEIVRELILQRNANMCAVDSDGRTPFDIAFSLRMSHALANALPEIYGNKLAQDHGRLALHKLLKVAKYSFAEDKEFHPPLNPLQIILLLGKLTLKHLRTVLHTLDPALFRNRDDTGKLPIHIACQKNAPLEVLALILELDPAVLRIADSTGALPIHLLCGATPTAGFASLRYLVEQGGAGTLAARDRQGRLPLHVLCRSTNPPLRTVQYLIQSFPGSVAAQTKAGQYPFMMAAAGNSSLASLSVIYELVRANPGLVVLK